MRRNALGQNPGLLLQFLHGAKIPIIELPEDLSFGRNFRCALYKHRRYFEAIKVSNVEISMHLVAMITEIDPAAVNGMPVQIKTNIGTP